MFKWALKLNKPEMGSVALGSFLGIVQGRITGGCLLSHVRLIWYVNADVGLVWPAVAVVLAKMLFVMLGVRRCLTHPTSTSVNFLFSQENDSDEVRDYAIAFVLLGVINFVSAVLQFGLLAHAGESLTCRIRKVRVVFLLLHGT